MTSRRKMRNYLSNTSYAGVTKEDFYNRNQNKHEMIYMLWKECIPAEFYKFICKEEHFLYLNGKNVLYQKIREIVWKFIYENENIYNQLRNNFCQFKEIFQYVYLIVYPEIYCTTERRGFNLKSTFKLVFIAYKDKKKLEHLDKEPSNFTKERNQTFKFKQKALEIDDFNNAEE